MNIEAARFTADALELDLDGKTAFSNTKQSLLEAGIVVLLDADPAGAPHFNRITSATLPADPGDGRPEPLNIPGGTTDEGVLALARRYRDAINADDFVPGPVPVA